MADQSNSFRPKFMLVSSFTWRSSRNGMGTCARSAQSCRRRMSFSPRLRAKPPSAKFRLQIMERKRGNAGESKREAARYFCCFLCRNSFSSMVEASANIFIIERIIKLLQSLKSAACEGFPPRSKILMLIDSMRGAAASSACGSPAKKIESAPSRARSGRPDTGAARKTMPFSRCLFFPRR